MKLVPYMTIGNDLEMMQTLSENDEDILVYFEKPDPVYFFKNTLINIDKMIVLKREGFSDGEIQDLIEICKNNYKLLKECSKIGGASNYA